MTQNKKITIIIIIIGIATLFSILLIRDTSAQSASVWFPDGQGDSYLVPVDSLWGLKVPGLATSTTGCLGVNSTGWISASGSACGTGVGGGGDNPGFDFITIGGTSHSASSTRPFYFGQGLLAASSTLGYLNVGYINATSTTATSTFAGGLTVNGTGFVVNQGVPANSFNVNANGNVGIGTAGPQALLSLAEGTTAAGGIKFGSDTYLYRDGTGQLTLAGNTSTTNHGVLAITNSDSNENGAIITGFNPTLNTGNAVGIVWGEDSSAYNSTYFQFVKVGDNSSSNRMDMGFSNVSNFLSITGLTNATFSGALTVQGAGNSQFTGNVGIGIDPVYPFAVSGVTYLSNGNGDNFLPYTDGNDYISAPNIIFRNSSNGEVARIITSTGSVGIGTTSPYSLLSISNSASTAANTPLFTIASTTAGTATSTLMTVLANGNVGIGTAGPVSKLEITTTGADSTITVGQTGVTAKTAFGTNSGGGYVGQFFTGANESSESVRYDTSKNAMGITYDNRAGVNQVNYNMVTAAGALSYPFTINMGAPASFAMNNTGKLAWTTSASAYDNGFDAGISRTSAGLLEINNGTAGTLRDLYLRSATTTGQTVLARDEGNVGIGTTTPGSILSVQSVGNFMGGTSTIYSNLSVGNITATNTLSTLGSFKIGTENYTSFLGNGLDNTAGVLTANCVEITGSADLCDGGDATAAGASDPFTWATNFGTTSAATTSSMWLRGGALFASSTLSWINGLTTIFSTSTNATSTNFNASNSITLNNWALATTTTVCRAPEKCQYQADGTNDNVEIQRALDSLASGGTAHIKAGTYNIGYPIIMTDNQRLLGDGNATILAANASFGRDIITTATTSDSTRRNLAVEYMKIDGNRANNTTGRNLYMFNTRNSTFNNLWLTNCEEECLYMDGGSSEIGYLNTISDNQIDEADLGMNFKFTEHDIIRGNFFSHIDGIAFNGQSDMDLIVDNFFDDIIGYGVYLQFGTGQWRVIGNSFERMTSHSIVTRQTPDVIIDGNYIEVTDSTNGILNGEFCGTDGSNRMTISNNIFHARTDPPTGTVGIAEGCNTANNVYVNNNLVQMNTPVSLNANSVSVTRFGNSGDTLNNIIQSGTSTYYGGITAPVFNATSTVASSTLRGLILSSGGFKVSTLTSCTALETDGSGNVLCGSDATGAGGSNPFSSLTVGGTIYQATTSPLYLSGGMITGTSTVGTLTATSSPIFLGLSGILKGNNTSALTVAADGTDFTLIDALTCSGTDKFSAVTADGTFTCSADQTAAGAADPFTWATNFGTTSAATTSSFWLRGGAYYASSSATSTFEGGFSSGGLKSTEGLVVSGGDITSTGNIVIDNNVVFGTKDASGNNIPLLYINSSNDAHFMPDLTGAVDSAFFGFNSPVPFQIGGSCCGGSSPTTFTVDTSGNHVFKPGGSTVLQLSPTTITVPTLLSCTALETDGSGNIGCGSDATGAGFSYPFTIATNFGTTTNATSTSLWLQGGSIFASSTSSWINGLTTLLSTSTNATSSNLAITSALRLNSQRYTSLDGAGLTVTGDALTIGAGTCITANANDVAVTSNCTDAATVDSIEGASLLRSNASDNYTSGTLTFDASTILTLAAGTFVLPNGTNPTTDDVGEISLDTTDNQLIVATSTLPVGVIRTRARLYGFSIASTTLSLSGFVAGQIMPLSPETDGFTMWFAQCNVWAGTSVTINFTDAAGNDTNSLTCDTATSTQRIITTNNVFTAGEGTSMEISAVSGVVNRLNVSVFGVFSRE